MPGPRATSFGRRLLPRRPRCSPRRRLRDTAPVREGDKLHKSCRPAPERRCFVLSAPTLKSRSRDKPAATPHRAPPARAGHPPRAAPQCRPPCAASPALAPALPRGNLKHGAPNRGFRQIEREKARGPSRPFRRGLRRRPPTPPHRPMFRLRAPAQPMLQRGGGRRARPGARGAAHRLGPAGIPAGEQAGSELGLAESGLGRFRPPCSAGATRQRRSPARLAPGLRLILRTSQKGDPLGSPRSSRQKSYLGWARSPGAPRRVDGLGARLPGCAQEARAWGGSRRRGLFAAAPRPPLQGIRRLGGAAAGAHAQRPRRESQPRPDSASRLRGNGPPQYLRTVTW